MTLVYHIRRPSLPFGALFPFFPTTQLQLAGGKPPVAKKKPDKPAPVSTAKTISLESLKILTDRVHPGPIRWGVNHPKWEYLSLLIGAFVCVCVFSVSM